MNKVTTEQQFKESIGKEKPTVAVFKATWCKDCHFIEPFMPEVVRQYADQLDFIHVDRDELPDICEQYRVMGIPSFIAFKQGKELIRFVSKLQKNRAEIEQFLDRVVEVSRAV